MAGMSAGAGSATPGRKHIDTTLVPGRPIGCEIGLDVRVIVRGTLDLRSDFVDGVRHKTGLCTLEVLLNDRTEVIGISCLNCFSGIIASGKLLHKDMLLELIKFIGYSLKVLWVGNRRGYCRIWATHG